MRTVKVITRHHEPVLRSGNRIWDREWQVEKEVTVGKVFDILRRKRGLRAAIAFWLYPRDIQRKKVAHRAITAAAYLKRQRLKWAMQRYFRRNLFPPLAYNVAFERFTEQKPLDSGQKVLFTGYSV